jgi:hypothetical protein
MSKDRNLELWEKACLGAATAEGAVTNATSFHSGVVRYLRSSRSRLRLYWTKIGSFVGGNAPQTEQQAASPSDLGKVKVLGNRVRCDNRYQELKIPDSEYRAFLTNAWAIWTARRRKNE